MVGMGGTVLRRPVFFLARLFGLWHVSDDMPPDEVARKALKKWRTSSAALEHLLQQKFPGTNVLLASCLLWSAVEPNNPLSDLQTLRKLLEALPAEIRGNAFQLASSGDIVRATSLLLALLPSVPPGLAQVAKKIAEQWIIAGRHDDRALTFSQSLTAYGVPQAEAQWLLAQALVARSQFTQAEPLLLHLGHDNPSSEVWWQLTVVFQALHRPPEQLLWALNCFMRSVSADPRTGQALETLGDLYREMLSSRPPSENVSSVHTLRGLLAFFPEHMRAETLSLMAVKHGDSFLAQILIALPPPTLAGFSAMSQSIMTRWAAEARSDDLALQFYRMLPAYGIPQLDAHLLLARALMHRAQYHEAEPVLKQLATIHTSPDMLWFLAFAYQELHRPPQLQLEAWLQFVKSAPHDGRASQVLQTIGTLYRQLVNTSENQREVLAHLQSLRTLLASFQDSRRVEVLTQLVNHDDTFLAQVLSFLASPPVAGLDAVAQDIKARWERDPRSDDLALRFYQSLPEYGVPRDEVLFLLARAFIRREAYIRAEQILNELVEQHSPSDVLHVQRTGKDERAGLAWKMIGDLRGEHLGDGMGAVQAYQKAVALGQEVHELCAFYAGQWDAIPALCHHPDYAFPIVVTLDLEVDPGQGQAPAPGSRVFEVAAVRYRGQTSLDHYCSYIRRDFCPKKWDKKTAQARLGNAPSAATVAHDLSQFIGDAIVVGHNLRAFDAPQLQGMGVTITHEHMIDTLLLARLLHPDSLRHHLALLCQIYNIAVDPVALHTALPDAQACAQLFHALGDSLAQREAQLLTGIQALVTPGSAFDRAILQPRNIPANPMIAWDLDAAPLFPRSITPLRGNPASPAMQQALRSGNDQFIELTDYDACFADTLSTSERTLVTLGSRTRIERILAHHPEVEKLFVLPDPQTLLCPRMLRRAIEDCVSSEQKLHLFCLYQASHNHDAATLYPLRLPAEALDDPEIAALRQILLEACCPGESDHGDDCPAWRAVTSAIATHPMLLSTHEVLLRQPALVQADTIVIDDIVHLQMNLAAYSATTLASNQVKTWLRSPEEQAAFSPLEAHIQHWAIDALPTPGYHERLPLSSLTAYLSPDKGVDLTALLMKLKQAGKQGEKVALLLEELLRTATQKPRDPVHTHAFWIDLWFEHKGGMTQLQSWRLCGTSQDLRQLFKRSCWKPYSKHLLAGPALAIGGSNTEFLERSLGIAGNLPYQQDPRPRKRVYLPVPEHIPPAGFLQRGKWILQVGALLAARVRDKHRAILVTLNNRTAVEAFIQAFQQTRATAGRQVLATQLNWTVTKINERMRDPARQSLVFASPGLRQTLLDSAVDLEISGPLRFLNRRDPLVIAQMQVFSHLYQEDGPFKAYLLPQALLELQMRLTSASDAYIICDGSLLSKGYRDEVLHMLNERADVQELADQNNPAVSEQFLDELGRILAQQGLDPQASVSDADLSLILRSVWETDTFREFPPLEKKSPPVTQKDVVRAVLDEKDQLVIAATGGGKSLCFQLPAIILAEETVPKVTLVFSPLIALMSNQVEQLNRKGIFSAIMLNSTLSIEKRQEHLEGLKKGYYSIVYLAPEQIYSRKLREVLQQREIGLIAIDEAHCISQWGHNFRTDYFAIKKWIEQVLCSGRKRDFPILALTATARSGYKDTQHTEQSDQASTVSDIIGKLGLRISEDEVVLSSAIRPELEFHFAYITQTQSCPQCKHTYEYRADIGTCPACGYRPRTSRRELQQSVAELKKQRLLSLLSPDPQHRRSVLPDLSLRWSPSIGTRQRGLIYCAYQSTTEAIAAFLRKEIPGLRVGAYHAGMDNADRDDILRRFTSDTDQGLDVVACTNAFGMGIDVRRLGFVIHFDTPATPEAYYQEAGRAGRDSLFGEGKGKQKAQCVLLFHPSDLEKQRFLSSQNSFTDYELEDVYQALCDMDAREKEYALQSNLPDVEAISSTSQPRTIFATGQEIAERAGVHEDRVNTLLYYLEYQTKDTVHHQPIVARGAYASNIWQLSFAKDYPARLRELPSSSASWPLLKVFQGNSDYQLSTDQLMTISARELADGLHLSLRYLEKELLNLVRRGIIHYKGSGQFKLHAPLSALQEKLKQLEQDLRELFRVINTSKKAFGHNERVTVNIRALMSKHNINSVTLSQLTHVFFRHSLESSEPLRLFEQFRRATRHGQPEHYELQLWLNRDPHTGIFAIIHGIITPLVETLEILGSRMRDVADTSDWYAIDVFAAELHLTYGERRKFHQQLLLLESLGLLTYRSDPALGQAMQLTLLQPPVSREQLEIDLRSLRLQESYAKSKRKLMAHYATPTQKELYAQQFASYFQGEKPLLELNSHELRQDLTQQQRQVATLTAGTHVIEGPAGCGKTMTLAEHVKHLINQQVPIDHIMITTHYTSAEGHIAEALKDLESEGATAISTTINAFGSKIFLQYRALLRRPDGTVYYRATHLPQLLKSSRDSQEELPYINQALKQVAGRDFVELVHHRHWPWPAGLDLPQFAPDYRSNAAEEDRFQAAIHRLRQYGIFPTTPLTREQLVEILGEHAGVYSVAEFYAVYLTFIEVLAEASLYTYDDQIVFALAILRTNPEILREYQRYFEHIIIDELQDFSPAKVELLMELCEKHTNILAFGDIFQEVQFDNIPGKGKSNGENVKVAAQIIFSRLAQRDTCEPGKTHQLTVNFRSTQEILDFATSIRRKASNRAAMELKSGQNKHGPKPAYLYTDTGSLLDTLNAALEQIEQLTASEKESIVLIFGGTDMLRQAQNVLKQRNIPFSLMDGQKTQYQLHYVKNLLSYFYLVEDKTRDDDTERLLRYNIVPYFEKSQILTLKKLANREGMSLFETVSSPRLLQEARISKAQRESLQRHLALINQSTLDAPISQFEQSLRELNDGPLTLLQEQEDKLRDVETILQEFGASTIKATIAEIRRHITFLDKHRGRTDVVLTTVEYSKSQEFETVFLMGLGRVFGKRLYVAVSRAKQRLFLVGDEEAFAKNYALSQVPRGFYTKLTR